MQKALRRKSTDPSLIDGFQLKKSSPAALLREWIFGERPVAPGAAAARARAARSDGVKLEALEPTLLLSAALSAVPLAYVIMFETEGRAPPVVAASFSPSTGAVSHALPSDTVQAQLSALTQVVFPDTDGALDVDYNGPMSVTGIDVPH